MKITKQAEQLKTHSRKIPPTRTAARNRTSTVPISSTAKFVTNTQTTTQTPNFTSRSLRRKLVSRTPTLSRRPQEKISVSNTTVKIPEEKISEIDDAVVSILPALTSAKPRKSNTNLSENYTKVTTNRPLVNESVIDKSSSFDQIIQHQLKIKGLDKDYEEEEFDSIHKNHNEEEKLIGVLGSQVKVILHSVSSENSKIECLETGIYPHPINCKMYISCTIVKGFLEGNIFSCADGMLFDPTSGVCDWNTKIGGCTRNNVRLVTS